MTAHTFTIEWLSRTVEETEPLASSDELVMNRLLSRGVTCFYLDWGSDFRAQLLVEDDILFLFDAFRELGRFLRGTDSRHVVFLGDGELVITSLIRDGLVQTEASLTPHLVPSLRRRFYYDMSPTQYESGWRNIVQQLLQQL